MARSHYQCPRPVIPESWRGDGRRFANELIDLISTIYSWRGQLDARDLTDKCVDEIARVSSERASIKSNQIEDLRQYVESVIKDELRGARISSDQLTGLSDKVSGIMVSMLVKGVADAKADRIHAGELMLKSGMVYSPIRDVISRAIRESDTVSALRLLERLRDSGAISAEVYTSVANQYRQEVSAD